MTAATARPKSIHHIYVYLAFAEQCKSIQLQNSVNVAKRGSTWLSPDHVQQPNLQGFTRNKSKRSQLAFQHVTSAAAVSVGRPNWLLFVNMCIPANIYLTECGWKAFRTAWLIDWLIGLRFYVTLDTRQVISEMLFPSNTWHSTLGVVLRKQKSKLETVSIAQPLQNRQNAQNP